MVLVQSQLTETHVEIAQQLQGEGAFKEAEKHFVEGGDWKGGVQMYRAAGMWEGSLRLAKAHGGALATKQVSTSACVLVTLCSLASPPLLPLPPPRLYTFMLLGKATVRLCATNVTACVSVCATMGSNSATCSHSQRAQADNMLPCCTGLQPQTNRSKVLAWHCASTTNIVLQMSKPS